MSSRPPFLSEEDILGALRDDVLHDPSARSSYEDQKLYLGLLDQAARIRRRRGLTQKEVASILGTIQSAVSDLELGRVDPDLPKLQRYARALGSRLELGFGQELSNWRDGSSDAAWGQLERAFLGTLVLKLAAHTLDRDRSLDALTANLGITPELLLLILDSLLARGWVLRTRYKDSYTYAINFRAANAIGIGLTTSQIIAAVTDLSGAILATTLVRLPNSHPKSIVSGSVSAIEHLMASTDVGPSVIGIGVALAGIVKPNSGQVSFAPDLQSANRSWHNVELESILQRAVGRLTNPPLHVMVESDVNAIATQEQLVAGEPSLAVVALSASGVAAGLVVGGQLVRGDRFASGEGSGHIVIDPSGPPCISGLPHRGCLNTIASPRGILESLGIPARGAKGVEGGLAELNSRATRGDRYTIKTLEAAGAVVGRFIASLISLTDPTRVAMYSAAELAKPASHASARYFQEGVQAGLVDVLSESESNFAGPRLEFRSLEVDGVARAASMMAIHRFLAAPDQWPASVSIE